MELLDKGIEDWLITRPRDDFPNNRDYASLYNIIKDNSIPILSKVTESMNITDGTEMTNHDFGHINMVFEKTTELLKAVNCNLKPYEVFLLSISVLIHDSGNLFGRASHENNTRQVLDEIYPNNGDNHNYEKLIISKIASTHGGKINGDKEKIGKIEDDIMFSNQKIRMRLLAAVLRLADELSDEPGRATNDFVRKNGYSKEGSEIYHEYAKSINSTVVNHDERTILLIYNLTKGRISTKYGKETEKDKVEKIFLFDEIVERIIKTYLELRYCQRFMKDYIIFDYLKIEINIYSDNYDNELKKLKFKLPLQEINYPKLPLDDFWSIYVEGDSKTPTGSYWNGEELFKFINNLE